MVTRMLNYDTYEIESLDDTCLSSTTAHVSLPRLFGHTTTDSESKPIAVAQYDVADNEPSGGEGASR